MSSSSNRNMPAEGQRGCCGAKASASSKKDRDSVDGLLETIGHDFVGALSAEDQCAYVWDLLNDKLEWEANATSVLGVNHVKDISSGKAFETRIVTEHLPRRIAAITAGTACPFDRGVPYRIQYRFRPGAAQSNASIWLEDYGRWWPGADGRPARARGAVRVVDEASVAEQKAHCSGQSDELARRQSDCIRLPQILAAVLGRTERRLTSSGFLMISVNNLSAINESFGFEIGDEVLEATAGIIKSKLGSGDLLGRYSSNKFGVVLRKPGAGAMRIAAERFMKAVRNAPIRTSACQLSATISVGGVLFPDQAATVRQVFGRSLLALSTAKTHRVDSFVCFEPDNAQELVRQRRITIADDIMSALKADRMCLVLQPIINANSRRADLFECLLRMKKTDGTVVSAGEFIPFAEQFGLLHHIDRRTLNLAVGLLSKHPRLSLSVNVSSITASDQNWLATLQELTGCERAVTERLVLEITETNIIDDIDQAVAFVNTLRELGCRVALDDFGAGYTSFKNLKRLPVDLLKIDGSFVKNLANDASDRIFVKTMVELADTFGMETVAEWVGDEESARILTRAGVTYLQGFHFGKPIPVEELPGYWDMG